MRTRRRAASGLALAVALLVLAPVGAQSTAASFTASVETAGNLAGTLLLEPPSEGIATRDGEGVAEVQWREPPARSEVEAQYMVSRTVGDVATDITPAIIRGTLRETSVGFSDDLTVPAALASKTVTAMSISTATSCVVADGAAYCWGDGSFGQLGDGSLGSNTAVAVEASGALKDKTVTAISAGGAVTCAVADGAAYCWGDGSLGQLGNGTTNGSSTPVPVDTNGVLEGRTVTAISAGTFHVCAIADGLPFCWGSGGEGQLGDGDATQSSTVPIAVDLSGTLAGESVTAIGVGINHSCALAHGLVSCWGADGSGQLGAGGDSTVPVAVEIPARTVTDLSVGPLGACVVADSPAEAGEGWCWGDNTDSTGPSRIDSAGPLSGKPMTAISTGLSHSCAVAAGTAYCWGEGRSGQLGNGSSDSPRTPTPVSTDSALGSGRVTAISVAGSSTCAIADDRAFCWGEGSSGQLGNAERVRSSLPVAVDVSGVLSGHRCADDWTLTSHERCAPGPSVPVSYRIDYSKAGWTPDHPLELPAPWTPLQGI